VAPGDTLAWSRRTIFHYNTAAANIMFQVVAHYPLKRYMRNLGHVVRLPPWPDPKRAWWEYSLSTHRLLAVFVMVEDQYQGENR